MSMGGMNKHETSAGDTTSTGVQTSAQMWHGW